MGFLKIHCGKCKGTWEVYDRDDWHNERAQTCPHCFTMINRQAWQQIILAFAEMEDANNELLKDHIGDGRRQRPLTRVDYIADTEKRE